MVDLAAPRDSRRVSVNLPIMSINRGSLPSLRRRIHTSNLLGEWVVVVLLHGVVLSVNLLHWATISIDCVAQVLGPWDIRPLAVEIGRQTGREKFLFGLGIPYNLPSLRSQHSSFNNRSGHGSHLI